MMSRLLAKKLPTFFPSPDHRIFLFTPLFQISKLSTQTQTQVEQPQDTNFMAQYLVSSFGFSRDRAIKVSKSTDLAAIKTPERPDSVLSFLKRTGLSDTQVKAVISWHPQLLAASVENVLEPRARELVADGFTRETLVEVIRSNPIALELKSTLPRLEFWRDFISKSEKDFLKFIKRNKMLLTFDIDRKVMPNLNILRERGLSHKEILTLMMQAPCFIIRSPEYIRQRLEQTESLGLPPSSGMFVHGLSVVANVKKETLYKKFEFFKKNYGWLQEDVRKALHNAPNIFHLSEEKVKSKMDFLVEKAGLKREAIISQPTLLGYSLEKRMVPRYYVLNVLKSKGLEISCNIFPRTIMITDKDFVDRFIVRYKKEAPELADAYAAACAGNIPISQLTCF